MSALASIEYGNGVISVAMLGIRFTARRGASLPRRHARLNVRAPPGKKAGMTVRWLFSLVATTAALACNEQTESPQPRGSAELAKPAQVEAEPEKKEADAKTPVPADDGAAEPVDDAAGEAADGAAVTDCPESLGGRENVDRTITKACGVVAVTGNYSIEGATLTLEAGVTLAFKDGAELSVGYYEPAKIVVQGTKAEPVTFTSGGDKAPGVWKGLRLYPKSSRSSIDGLVVEYAGNGKGAVMIEGEDVVFKNSTVRHAKGLGLEATVKATFAEFTGNRFEDVGNVAVRMPPQLVGSIGVGNTFDAKSRIHIPAGTVEADATWPALGVPYLVVGEVRVDGKEGVRSRLTIAEGARIHFDGDARMSIGYYAEGTLTAKGSSSKPVVFGSNDRREPGSWRGIAVYGKGEAELEQVTFEHGGKREAEGVLLGDNRSRITVKQCTFRANKAGIVLRGADVEAVAIDGNTFESTPLAIRLPAHEVGALGPGNVYEGDARVIIEGGKTGKDAKWVPQKGATVELDGNLGVDGGTLEVAPGFALLVTDGVGIDVGYYENAALRLMGTATEPIRLVGTRDEPGTWKSVVFHRNAHGNEIRHVQIANAGGEGGVVFKRESDGKIDTLTCEKCSGPALQRDDKAQVEATNVK
jgi:hypothetical protein